MTNTTTTKSDNSDCNLETEHPLDRRDTQSNTLAVLSSERRGLPSFGSGSLSNLGSGSQFGSLPLSGSIPSIGSSTSSSNESTQVNSACSNYIVINTRGTGEIQGPSAAFRTINSQILAAFSGGKTIDTVYPAAFTQDSTSGTKDIVSHVTSALSSNANVCIILQGYSQGAAATVNAMKQLTGSNMSAIKGVFLVGNPLHKSGLTCNVDNSGGSSTRNVNGMSAALGSGIPADWVDKTLDVCISGDGVCDTAHGVGINAQHLSYPNDANTQKLGVAFIKAVLSGQAYTHS